MLCCISFDLTGKLLKHVGPVLTLVSLPYLIKLVRVQLSSKVLVAKRSHTKVVWEATHPFT